MEFAIEIEIETHNARRSSEAGCAEGWDVDVRLIIGGATGRSVHGEVTLMPGAGGELAMWGDMSNWLSSSLCEIVRDLTGPAGRQLCHEIEVEARGEVEATEEEIHAEVDEHPGPPDGSGS